MVRVNQDDLDPVLLEEKVWVLRREVDLPSYDFSLPQFFAYLAIQVAWTAKAKNRRNEVRNVPFQAKKLWLKSGGYLNSYECQN